MWFVRNVCDKDSFPPFPLPLPLLHNEHCAEMRIAAQQKMGISQNVLESQNRSLRFSANRASISSYTRAHRAC